MRGAKLSMPKPRTRNAAARLRRDDALAEGQNAPVFREDEDIVLKDDGAHARMRLHDALDHLDAFVGFEPRNARDAALSFVQEVGGRAERARHRAVVESDQAHGADLCEARLAGRLGRQRADPIGALEPVPIGPIGHALVRGAEDRAAQLVRILCALVPSRERAVRQQLDQSRDVAQ